MSLRRALPLTHALPVPAAQNRSFSKPIGVPLVWDGFSCNLTILPSLLPLLPTSVLVSLVISILLSQAPVSGQSLVALVPVLQPNPAITP